MTYAVTVHNKVCLQPVITYLFIPLHELTVFDFHPCHCMLYCTLVHHPITEKIYQDVGTKLLLILSSDSGN